MNKYLVFLVLLVGCISCEVSSSSSSDIQPIGMYLSVTNRTDISNVTCGYTVAQSCTDITVLLDNFLTNNVSNADSLETYPPLIVFMGGGCYNMANNGFSDIPLLKYNITFAPLDETRDVQIDGASTVGLFYISQSTQSNETKYFTNVVFNSIEFINLTPTSNSVASLIQVNAFYTETRVTFFYCTISNSNITYPVITNMAMSALSWLDLTECTFFNNTLNEQNLIVLSNTFLQIHKTQFIDNTGKNSSLIQSEMSQISIFNSTFSQNHLEPNYGIINLDKGILEISGSNISYNSGNANAATVYFYSASSVTVQKSTFLNNEGDLYLKGLIPANRSLGIIYDTEFTNNLTSVSVVSNNMLLLLDHVSANTQNFLSLDNTDLILMSTKIISQNLQCENSNLTLNSSYVNLAASTDICSSPIFKDCTFLNFCPTDSTTKSKGLSDKDKIIIGVVCGVAGGLCLILVAVFIIKRFLRRKDYHPL